MTTFHKKSPLLFTTFWYFFELFWLFSRTKSKKLYNFCTFLYFFILFSWFLVLKSSLLQQVHFQVNGISFFLNFFTFLLKSTKKYRKVEKSKRYIFLMYMCLDSTSCFPYTWYVQTTIINTTLLYLATLVCCLDAWTPLSHLHTVFCILILSCLSLWNMILPGEFPPWVFKLGAGKSQASSQLVDWAFSPQRPFSNHAHWYHQSYFVSTCMSISNHPTQVSNLYLYICSHTPLPHCHSPTIALVTEDSFAPHTGPMAMPLPHSKHAP